jgi:anhydro-N-acetylmuramic acid kinase
MKNEKGKRGGTTKKGGAAGRLVVGLMSGTSLDGIDAVLLRVWGSGTSTRFVPLAYREHPFPRGLRAMLLRNSIPGTSRVDDIARLNMLLPQLYADAVRALARKVRISVKSIALIGMHGQTIHHLPQPVKMFGKIVRATLQIGDPSALATLTGVPTVGNFRVADMAAGGEGAPLVPYFDWLVFRSRTRGRLLLNIGGIANVTVLPKKCTASDVVAFDTGPGNMLVDGLMQRLYRRRFDRGGETAGRGTVLPELLRNLARHPYFRRKPPKSTGREIFGEVLIEEILRKAKGERAEDVIHTAALLTPLTVFDAYERFIRTRSPVDEIIVSGGGARNFFFLESLRELFGGIALGTADAYGINGDAKEAMCFAILANETIAGHPGNLPRVTGARRPVMLGAVCRP